MNPRAFLFAAAAVPAWVVASCSDADVPLPLAVPIFVASDASPDVQEDVELPDAGGDAPDEDAGHIVSASPDSLYEGETQVAVSSDGTIAVAWIATDPSGDPYASVGYRFSMDQGQTWTPIRYVPQEFGSFTGDPSIAVADNGDFYIGWLAVELGATGIGGSKVYVGRVPAGSDEIASDAEASDPLSVNTFRDHPKMAVTQNGTVVIGYLEAPSFEDPYGPGVSAYSMDQGVTWQHGVVHEVAPDEFVNLLYFCRSDGSARLYATYFYASSTKVDVLVRGSDDDGASWSAPVGVNKGPILAGGVDPTCVAQGNDVWVGFGVSNLPQIERSASQAQQGIKIAHSTDQGASFPEVLDATDKTTGKLFLHPTVAVERDGALDLVFYAGQAQGDREGAFLRRRWQAGVFGPSEPVASPLTFELLRSTPDWLGDYVGLTVHGGALHVAYTDNGSGTSHVGYQRIDLP